MSFRISGLDPAPFTHLYELSDRALRARGVTRYVVDAMPGYPDRIGVCDVALGERVLLLNYVHQPADSAYRASHAIYVREGATKAYVGVAQIPSALAIRAISLRAFDRAGAMVDAELIDGTDSAAAIERLFAAPMVAYLHAHYAKRGCYAARIDRVG